MTPEHRSLEKLIDRYVSRCARQGVPLKRFVGSVLRLQRDPATKTLSATQLCETALSAAEKGEVTP